MATEIRPDVPLTGTLVAILVEVAELTAANVVLNLTVSMTGFVSKFVPVIVTAVPAVPIVGVNPVIVGAPVPAVTVNGVLLVAEPPGAVTVIGPVVAPAGTLATICVAVAEVTVPAVPLNVTVFWLAVVLNPVPLMVTEVPTGPLFGVKPMMETWVAELREIERRLPTAS